MGEGLGGKMSFVGGGGSQSERESRGGNDMRRERADLNTSGWISTAGDSHTLPLVLINQ